MKKLFTGLMAFLIVSGVTATKPMHERPVKASEVIIYLSKDKMISLYELATMSRSEYEVLRGKKLNLFERIHLKIAQNKLRNDMNGNGELIGKKYEKIAAPRSEMNGTSGFHLGGAALGFFLGPIGVLIAYLLKDEKKKNRVMWAWIGFAAALVLGLGIGFLL